MRFYKDGVLLVLFFVAFGSAEEDMREGDSQVIDLDDTRDSEVQLILAKEDTMQKMKANLARKCNNDKPADIMMKKKSGMNDEFIVTLCTNNIKKKNRFKGRFSMCTFIETEMKTRKMSVFKVTCPYSNIQEMARHTLVADIEQEELIEPVRLCEKQKLNTGMWSLDRIGQRKNSVLDGKYLYNTKYQEEVDVYVVDTGVQANAYEFGDRLKVGKICIDSGCFDKAKYPGKPQDSQTDKYGHGTHVAGIIGSLTYGMAKKVNIIPAKVMDHYDVEEAGRFTVGTIINALAFVLDTVKENKKNKLSVVNISLGGPLSTAINRAITDIYDEGITVVAAAGNGGTDSCKSSPGSATGAITVGATDKSNNFCSFSNHGKCVDILAPGHDVLSLDSGKKNDTKQTGTSMSAPHVAGGVAILMAQNFKRNGGLTPVDVKTELLKLAKRRKVKGVPGGTTDRFLYVRCKR